ncbi:MAG: WecB/TagA/CpsF family glycosyltransferase [Selenomonadales bacterium]|nr:WecB/TagA/CpsF family glycosyltransferase [Selenomonadales bacterium]
MVNRNNGSALGNAVAVEGGNTNRFKEINDLAVKRRATRNYHCKLAAECRAYVLKELFAKVNAEEKYPGLNVCGVRDGFFGEDEEDDIVRMINEAKADFVLVALGVPKQENWIMRHKDKLTASLIIGVGGTLDVMAGVTARAPKWMQDMKLEWLFRLLCQPKRFLRMLALPRFVLAVIGAKKR